MVSDIQKEWPINFFQSHSIVSRTPVQGGPEVAKQAAFEVFSEIFMTFSFKIYILHFGILSLFWAKIVGFMVSDIQKKWPINF